MKDILIALKETPISTILILGGIFFLFIAVGGKFRTKINTHRIKQKLSAVIGIFLLCSGIALHLIPAIFLSEGTPPVNASDDNNIPKPDCGSYSIYDDFNDTAYSGSFNRNKWEPFSSSAGRIVQKNGMLTLSRTKGISDGIGLTAHEYQDFTLKNSFFLEAKLMVSEAQEGHVYLTISSDLDSEDYADCILGYGDKQASIGCSYSLLEEKEEKAVYKTLSMSANYGTWHIVRIDIETSTMTFTYHMDGQRIGSYVSKNAKKLKQAKFSIDIGVWGESTETVTGYIDYVCIGEIEQ